MFLGGWAKGMIYARIEIHFESKNLIRSIGDWGVRGGDGFIKLDGLVQGKSFPLVFICCVASRYMYSSSEDHVCCKKTKVLGVYDCYSPDNYSSLSEKVPSHIGKLIIALAVHSVLLTGNPKVQSESLQYIGGKFKLPPAM